MPKSRDDNDRAAALRAAAESGLGGHTGGKATSNDHILHDLEVHQVEVEMQNAELRGTPQELEMALVVSIFIRAFYVRHAHPRIEVPIQHTR
jgi:hypothetical protein